MTVVASKYAIKENSFYPTPVWATKAALRKFPLVGNDRVWEPCAGDHRISNTLKAEGFPNVFTSDIANYGVEHDEYLDFLTKPDDYNPFNANVIYTNPPYGPQNRLAVAFVRKALACEGIRKVAMLLTPKFDFGKTRTDLFLDNPYFVGKLHLLDRCSWADNGKTGTEDSAWYFWDKDQPFKDRFHPRMFYGGNEG